MVSTVCRNYTESKMYLRDYLDLILYAYSNPSKELNVSDEYTPELFSPTLFLPVGKLEPYQSNIYYRYDAKKDSVYS